jgi:serine protease inhibitor
MFELRRRASTFVLAAVVAACSSSTESHGAPAALTSLPRPLTSAERAVADAGNGFSISLFKEINASSPDSNVFISPLSASMALGMTLNGAAGSTFDAMRSTLGFGTSSQQSINAGYKGLIDLLSGLDRSTTFQLANSIWYRQGFPFEQTFLDTAKTYFDAEVRGLDFASPASLATINGWVNTKTNGKIPTILDRISSDDVMFLINAIYFKGSWRQAFDPGQTRDAAFHALGGTTETMRLMHRKGSLRIYTTAGFTLADLAYGNDAWTMSVLLPAADQDVNQIAASLTTEQWAEWTAQLHDVSGMDVALPKFKLTWDQLLVRPLTAMGMGVAFDRAANFTRLSAPGGLFIEYVKQKTFVDVNEVGTEAAAVTAVGIGLTSVGPSFTVDRPFIFAIRERLSGTILFMGKIAHMPQS